MEVERQSQ